MRATSGYLNLALRSEEQVIAELAEKEAKRMPLGDNDDLETDIGTYGRDDIDGTLPWVKLAQAPLQRCKDELEAIQKIADQHGRAAKAAFTDPVEWVADALEDLQTTQRAFTDALRAYEEGG